MPKFSIITPSHDIKYLGDAWTSLKNQTDQDFEWVVFLNGEARDKAEEVYRLTEGHPAVRVHSLWYDLEKESGDLCRDGESSDWSSKWSLIPASGVGPVKKKAFKYGVGEILVELDHDDYLAPDCLEHLRRAFEDPVVGFAYSDCIDFLERLHQPQGEPTYRNPATRAGWISNGFSFYEHSWPDLGSYECARSFAPSAVACSLIYWAPNHVRAWRRSVYEKLGGHSSLPIADDHELVARTYLATKMVHIPKPLYLYRVSSLNTYSGKTQDIRERTFKIQEEYLERLILRQCELEGKPAYDLGAALNPRPGWKHVDILPGCAVNWNLNEFPWPFETSSVGAFRAFDILEHLPDKMATMAEIYRCLAPGGWLLSMTPSTDGRGAFMDPTHCSYWNENSFWYWTRAEQAKYISGMMIDSTGRYQIAPPRVRFQELVLRTIYPSRWHEEAKISYVEASLIALKNGYEGPGIKLI